MTKEFKDIKFEIIFNSKGINSAKCVYANGEINIIDNKPRGIWAKKGKPIPFNSIKELVPALMKKMEEFGIALFEKDAKGRIIVINN